MHLFHLCLSLLLLTQMHMTHAADSRQAAAEACLKHRIQQHESCFVSHGKCPKGFETLAFFSDSTGTGFTACRDRRHTRGQTQPVTATAAMKSYNRFSEILKTKGMGEAKSLPNETIKLLRRHFSGFPLETLRFTQSTALGEGCFSDCEQIYCADATDIEQWTRTQNPVISVQLLHQIAHAESCRLHGGRERFVSRWFRYLPDEIHQQLASGEPVDPEKIHFTMFMENQAKHRSESICLRLSTCLQGAH
ncbi:MAG: hypothetical protein KZQ93_06395 [Candidatus Thiodiazotropha sp. (ex Monitilora ramsayi)]|nr:hypothetical protein [Candidatus Thiodiazotropha sp. (ex Monitilora ramsayi)]